MSDNAPSMEEVRKYINDLELQNQQEQAKNMQNAQGQYAQSIAQDTENLVRWQLDFSEDLDRIYHLLKGHHLGEDEKGNLTYIEPKDENLKPFNEFGVQMLMNIMRFYLNRNTILSNYDEDTIKWKVRDFGKQVTKLILMRYSEMGMDTPDKRKMYPMIVQELVDTVHSAYLRALYGGERTSLRQVMTVSQSQPLGSFSGLNRGEGSKRGRWGSINPRNWF